MNLKQLLRIFPLAAIFITTCPLQAENEDLLLDQVLAGSQRLPENVARDVHRHPKETLQYFGIRPDMHVIEILPGGGWYTEILAPYLSGNGRLTAASYGTNNTMEFLTGIHNRFMEKVNSDQAVFGKVTVVDFNTPQGYLTDVADGSVDMILDIRNTHNFIRWFGGAGEVYAAYFRVLKPGGVLGIIEHRAHPGTRAEDVANTGYTPEQYSIDVVQQSGFELAGTSEINANPKDTKDHPNGVWTLPPGRRTGGADAAKYEAIGESDRMTLKFIKPE